MTKNYSPWSMAIEIGNELTRGSVSIDSIDKIFYSSLPTNRNNPYKTAVELFNLVSGENTLDITMLEMLSTNIAFDLKKNNLISKSGLLITKGLLDKIQQHTIKYFEEIFEIIEINERILPEDNRIIPLDEAQIIEAVPLIAHKGITSLGICFLNSYSCSIHENRAMEILKRYLPEINISLSSEIFPKANEDQAILLTAFDAKRKNMIDSYLMEFKKKFGSSIEQGKFYFLNSEGFLVSTKSTLKNSTSSNGPEMTAGIRHCQSLALKTARNTLITIEIGSSYTSLGLLNKGILVTTITKAIPITLGSLYCFADKSNLQLHEIIGYLADSIYELTVQQGYDPRDYTLVSFGAIAPLYVEELAKALKVSRVIMPCQPEYFSVAWLLNATIKDSYRKYLNIPFENLSAQMLNKIYLEIENDPINSSNHLEHYDLTISRQLGIKWMGQNKISPITLPSGYLKQADLSLLKRSFLVDCEIEGAGIPDNIKLKLIYIELNKEYKKRTLLKEEPEHKIIEVSD
ncbi:MAG: hypothetical protein HGA27_02690 [Peptococcaceae bacterium]|nr:hypothetical protein [Peptococcaceae bacterium]